MRNIIDPLAHLGCLFAATGIVILGVMFFWPLVDYAFHYWAGK